MIPYVQTHNNLIINLDGKTVTIDSLHINYRKIQKALKVKDKALIHELLDIEDLMQNGIYLLYQKDVALAYKYLNVVKGIDFTIVIKDESSLKLPYGDAITTAVVDDWKHIGTFSSPDEIIDTYPEYFI